MRKVRKVPNYIAVARFLRSKGIRISSLRHIKIARAIFEYDKIPISATACIPAKMADRMIDELASRSEFVVIPYSKKSKKKERPVHTSYTKNRTASQGADFYWSDDWREVRYEALRASRGVCELCGSGPGKDKPLHVDHIKPRSRFPELELGVSNLQVLCFDCNLGKSNTDEIDWRRNGTSASD